MLVYQRVFPTMNPSSDHLGVFRGSTVAKYQLVRLSRRVAATNCTKFVAPERMVNLQIELSKAIGLACCEFGKKNHGFL